MEEREEEEKNALTTLFNNVLPNRKPHLGQNLRTNTGTHIKRHQQIRKHSLDDETISKGIDRYCDSSDDDFSYINSSEASGMRERYDYNWSKSIECPDGTQQLSLPEFVGKGGGIGIFKVPSRSAVHPSRPPCIELRPHPLRETQTGKHLKTIACTETQLWAGHESGVRVWKFADEFEAGVGAGAGGGAAAGVGNKLGGGGRTTTTTTTKRGDEDAAPFCESANTSPTMCLLVDGGNKLIWSGHKDGKIRSWKTDQPMDIDATPFKEGLSWQAHRGPVISLAFSAYGDLWSGFEGGVIKIWPWESIAKSLSLSTEERHMAALLVERSFIDLRNQVTVNGVCSISSQDVKCLLSDNVRAKMWAAGSFSFSLWDVRTRELLKVYNIDGQLENRVDMLTMLDQVVEDEMNIKLVSKSSKKEKPQAAAGNFLQRSRNAIMGAADAVRRAASKGTVAFQEEVKKTEAMVLAGDGMIWSGCSNGLLVQWDGNGNRMQDVLHHPSSVLCFCSCGCRIWVGYMSGMVHILDLEGNLIAGWFSHNSAVVTLVVGNGNIYSLATHGGIRGWNLASPGPLDSILRPKLAKKEHLYTRKENIKILVGTWNVSQGKPSQDALRTWLGSSVSDVGILVVGLQEVEMGAGFLAMSAAKETVGLEGSSIGQWWQDAIGKSLDEGSTFERVGSRQLAALLIAIWVRKSLRTHVGDLDVGAVACGLGRAIGNKGGVGLRLRVYDRIMCFVNCHFAAHLEAVNRRNADFDHIYRTMAFSKSTNLLTNATGMVLIYLFLFCFLASSTYLFWLLPSPPLPTRFLWILSVAAGVQTAAQMLRVGSTSAGGMHPDQEAKLDLAEADMVVFCGDFNYRLFGITYDEARDVVSQRCFDWLRERDQLRAEMKAGKVFHGLREALIRFPPTYKFEKGKPGLGGYDSGEKKRIPAWCDRILYRDNRSSPTTECTLECPVVASILTYEACMEVTESDHKPVRCKFHVEISHIDRSVRRQEFGKIFKSNSKIRAMLEELHYVPETLVSANRIVLENKDTYTLRITNKSAKDNVAYHIICEGQSIINEDDQQPSDFRPRGCFAFPRWLEVTPAAGVIKAEQTTEVMVRHEYMQASGESGNQGVPPSWRSEDTSTRDKEVVLAVVTKGNTSTETRTHRVNVRHSFSGSKTRAGAAGADVGGFVSGNSLRNKSQVVSSRGPAGHRHSYSTSDILNDSRL